MFEFGRNAITLEFNPKLYLKTTDKILGRIIREGARQWLRAILVSVPARGGFPVLTGAAKSTLAPLGRFLRVAVPVRPTGKKDRRAEGESLSHFEIESKDFNYTFEWSNDVLHYYINEFYSVIPHAPWHTVKAGEEAFEKYVEQAINTQLPDLADYISWSR